ncbi:MAG: TonB-dependent receptor [Novosphingobium sp.]
MTNSILNRKYISRYIFFALATTASTYSLPAAAQSSTDSETYNPDIIVTSARKREESVLDTPISIAALTGDELSQRGIATFSDLAQQTPGFNLNGNYSGRNDRSYAQLIIRGFTSSSPQTSTASMFIDGVPVSSATGLSSINNPARVEVLKGPQAAYFGRQTFAGAINVVNREPGDSLAGKASAMLGTRNNYEVYGEIEGPIVSDLLGIRLSAGKWSKDGSYTNSYNGSTLGDQSSQSYTAFVTLTPASNLKIRAFGMYSRDEDGAAANGLITSQDVVGSDGSIVHTGQSNCTLTGYSAVLQGQGTAVSNASFCGVPPKLANGPSANNSNDAVVSEFLDGAWAGLDGFGLARNFYHGHVNVDYDIGDTGLTLSSLTGYNKEVYATLLDSDNMGTTLLAASASDGREYYDYSYLSQARNKDFSQELRLSYDHGPIQATLGASYFNASSVTKSGGGQIPSATVVVRRAGKSKVKTIGIFGAVTYDLGNGVSLSAEGRYQEDTLSAYAGEVGTTVTNAAVLPVGFYPDGSLLLKKTYRNFMPRLIAQYDIPGTDLMAYASWSKAVNPARFNTSFLTYNSATIDAANEAGITVEVKPEKVTNYEIGLKGALFNKAVTFSSALYYAQWRDQANTLAFPGVTSTGTTQLLSAVANTGSVNLWGLELEANWHVNHIVTLMAGGAITDTKILDYTYPLASQLTGIFDFRGKEMPNTSKYSAVASIKLEDILSSSNDSTWFLRADYSFKSGVWSNAANVVRTPNRSLVNMRGGVTLGKARIEGFINNVFNDKTYTSIADNYIIAPGFSYAYNNALIVGLPDLRTAGVKVSVEF